MLLSEIKNVVKELCQNGCKVNLCLKGHQGIGKTQILQQVAEELGWDYKAIYCAQTSTEDLIGMPKIVENKDGTFSTEFAKPTLFPTKENTIFVLEEINRAPLEVQQSVLQLLTDKKIGNFVLPKNTLICACINPTDSIYMTQELDSVFVNRMVTIDVETNIEEFCNYAEKKGVNQDIINFIGSLNSSQAAIHFIPKPSENTIGKPMASPRTWMIADSILKLNVSDNVLAQMLSGAIGKETATFFLTTRNKLDKIINIESIIKNYEKVKTKIEKQSDGTLLKTVNDFAEVLNNQEKAKTYSDDEINNMGKFIEYLYNNNKALASMLYQKITDLSKDSLLKRIHKTYQSEKKIITMLTEVGTSIK